MTDPAISAARKVFTEYWPDQGDFEFNYSNEGRFGIEVAREALRPIQEWFGKVMLEAVIEDLYEQLDLLESLHPLIFTTGELER